MRNEQILDVLDGMDEIERKLMKEIAKSYTRIDKVIASAPKDDRHYKDLLEATMALSVECNLAKKVTRLSAKDFIKLAEAYPRWEHRHTAGRSPQTLEDKIAAAKVIADQKNADRSPPLREKEPER